ncbi:MAG: molybdopterin-dependent oxidoreductase, partial [Desulfobacteraceae bacterium]|nr:molybdopterin-dependent oxidoreductase [Desulfobacteraceae bacterium]
SFAAASKPLALCGRGKGATPVSMHEMIAVHALNVMMGNVNTEGGVYTVPEPDYIKWNKVDVSGTPMALNKIVSEKSPIQALLVSNANPLFTMSDTQAVKKAFDKIPFIVSFSSYMDETAQFSDLILPNHSYLERYEDVPAPAGFHKPVIGLTRPVVKPLFKTRHSGDAVIAMPRNRARNHRFPWENYRSLPQRNFGRCVGSLGKRRCSGG